MVMTMILFIIFFLFLLTVLKISHARILVFPYIDLQCKDNDRGSRILQCSYNTYQHSWSVYVPMEMHDWEKLFRNHTFSISAVPASSSPSQTAPCTKVPCWVTRTDQQEAWLISKNRAGNTACMNSLFSREPVILLLKLSNCWKCERSLSLCVLSHMVFCLLTHSLQLFAHCKGISTLNTCWAVTWWPWTPLTMRQCFRQNITKGLLG